MRIRKSQIKEFILVITVLLIILMSKTLYFGVINRRYYQYVFYIFVIISLLVSKISKNDISKGIAMISPLLGLAGISFILYHSQMSSENINQLLGTMLVIIFSMIAAIVLGKQRFAVFYIRFIVIICLVSLFCFLIANFDPDTAYKLCQPGYDWRTRYGYSFFYTWGWNGVIFKRNSGMFWEPGAFQGFLFLAMLLMIFETDLYRIKHRKSAFLVLTITMLTTQSTTGYILLIILILICWTRVQKIFGDIPKSVRLIVVLLLGLSVIYIIISSNNIANKFSGSTGESVRIRFLDIVGGLILCLKGGVFGLGENAAKESMKALVGINIDDSAGLLSMTYTYGLLFGAYYIGLMCKGIKKTFSTCTPMEYAMLLLSFFILHLTEGLWNLPVYLVCIFVGFFERTNTSGYRSKAFGAEGYSSQIQ